MLKLDHFLKADHEKAVRLYSLYQTHLTESKVSLHQGDYVNAEQYMMQASLMITELRRLSSNKKMMDEVEITLKKLNQRQMNDTMMQKRKDWF